MSDGVLVLLVIYTDWKKNQTIENVRQLYASRPIIVRQLRFVVS